MSDLYHLAKSLARREAERPALAYSLLAKAIKDDEPSLPLSDRDLVVASLEAIRRNMPSTATVALEELALRLAADEPEESIQRAA